MPRSYELNVDELNLEPKFSLPNQIRPSFAYGKKPWLFKPGKFYSVDVTRENFHLPEVY